MCNELHSDSKPIPPRGIGWKLFGPENTAAFGFNYPYATNDLGIIEWDDYKEEGFCFFISKNEAERCLKIMKHVYGILPNWIKNLEIVPIWYEQGMGKHIEYNITNGCFEIALCKVFGIMEE